MKKLNDLSKRIAFTLIELLVVITVIVILIGFLVKTTQNSGTLAKSVRTKNLMKKISEAIISFEDDWGQIPPSLSHLISTPCLKDFAAEKNISPVSYRPYLDKIPFKAGYGVYNDCYFCPNFHLSPASATQHAHYVPGNIGKTCGQLFSEGSVYGGVSGCTESLVKRVGTKGITSVTYEGGWDLILDAYGGVIYYFPDFDNGTYKLVSCGADKESSINDYEWAEHIYLDKNPSLDYDINSTDSRDLDNIYYEQNS